MQNEEFRMQNPGVSPEPCAQVSSLKPKASGLAPRAENLGIFLVSCIEFGRWRQYEEWIVSN